MSVPRTKKGETTSFTEAARTSVRPPRPLAPCTCTWKAGDQATDRWQPGTFDVVHVGPHVGLDGRHWVKLRQGDWTFHTECGTLRSCASTSSEADF